MLPANSGSALQDEHIATIRDRKGEKTSHSSPLPAVFAQWLATREIADVFVPVVVNSHCTRAITDLIQEVFHVAPFPLRKDPSGTHWTFQVTRREEPEVMKLCDRWKLPRPSFTPLPPSETAFSPDEDSEMGGRRPEGGPL